MLEGEVGYVLDNPNQYKIGDGVHAWNDLPLRGYTGTISQELGSSEDAVVSQAVVSKMRSRIFIGGQPKSERLLEIGYFDFIFDAYLDLDYNNSGDKFYFISNVNKTNKTFNLYEGIISSGERSSILSFAEDSSNGSLSVMSHGNSYFIVDWNLFTSNDIVQSIQYTEGAALNPILFKTESLLRITKSLADANKLIGYLNSTIYNNNIVESQTHSKSYITSNGTISETTTTTVDKYDVEPGDKILVTMFSGNRYTKAYQFYGLNDSIVSDNNPNFPSTSGNGVQVTREQLIVPNGAIKLGITYNNSQPHELVKVITNVATAYLGSILSNLGIDIEIGVSYAGGATLQSYWTNIQNKNAAYEFRRWKNGSWIEPDGLSTYDDIVKAEDWDIITHQQQSGNGGNYPSFQPYLHNIIEYEKKILFSVFPLIFMHATWAYPNGYDYEQFETLYGSDSDIMYNAILDAYNQAMVDENIVNVMPSAPMIQQVRNLSIPDIDTSDGGSHLSINGQYSVACVWAEMLLRNYFDQSVASDKSIENCTFKPSSLSEENAQAIRSLAKTIVQNVKSYFPKQK